MKPEEAIYVIKEYKPILGLEKYREALNVAISALEEIQQYREIGTVEECRDPMEKQIPKRIQHDSNIYNDGFTRYQIGKCPICGEWYNDKDEYNYCHKCGNKLNWSNENEQNE